MCASSSSASSIHTCTRAAAADDRRPGRRPPVELSRLRRRLVALLRFPPAVATSRRRWCLHPTHGHGRASWRHSALVFGRGMRSIGSGVCLAAVEVESRGSCTDAAVALASGEGVPAEPAVAGAERSLAGGLGVVALAAVAVLVAPSFEHVDRSLDGCEVGEGDGAHRVELAKSESWSGSITHRSPAGDRGTAGRPRCSPWCRAPAPFP